MLFAPFFSGAAGTGHVWWWRQALEQPNLWYHFSRFAEAVQGIDPPAEHFEPVLVSTDQLRLYILKGRKTVLAWCRDSKSDWKTELIQGQKPETLSNLDIDLGPYLPDPRRAKARVNVPWKNHWSDATIESGRIRLNDFIRSIVIRIDTRDKHD